MLLTIGEKIRVIIRRKNMTFGQLAEATRQSRQNLPNKMMRGNFTEQDARKIAKALGAEFFCFSVYLTALRYEKPEQ